LGLLENCNIFRVTHENSKFQIQDDALALLDAYVDSSRRILEKIKLLWPQFSLDGTLNVKNLNHTKTVFNDKYTLRYGSSNLEINVEVVELCS
jgi:hypothetical protein